MNKYFFALIFFAYAGLSPLSMALAGDVSPPALMPLAPDTVEAQADPCAAHHDTAAIIQCQQQQERIQRMRDAKERREEYYQQRPEVRGRLIPDRNAQEQQETIETENHTEEESINVSPARNPMTLEEAAEEMGINPDDYR